MGASNRIIPLEKKFVRSKTLRQVFLIFVGLFVLILLFQFLNPDKNIEDSILLYWFTILFGLSLMVAARNDERRFKKAFEAVAVELGWEVFPRSLPNIDGLYQDRHVGIYHIPQVFGIPPKDYKGIKHTVISTKFMVSLNVEITEPLEIHSHLKDFPEKEITGVQDFDQKFTILSSGELAYKLAKNDRFRIGLLQLGEASKTAIKLVTQEGVLTYSEAWYHPDGNYLIAVLDFLCDVAYFLEN